LLAVGGWCNQYRAKYGWKPVEKGNGLLVSPDDVVRRQSAVLLDQAADEATFLYVFKIGIQIKGNSRRLAEYARAAEGLSHELPVARRIALQPAHGIGYEAAVVEDHEVQAIRVGPRLAPLIVQPPLVPARHATDGHALIHDGTGRAVLGFPILDNQAMARKVSVYRKAPPFSVFARIA
jgi:hypothetical protein